MAETAPRRDILLIDDSAEDAELAVRAFARAPQAPRVKVLHDGIEAMEYLAGPKAGPVPDLILLDLKLDRVDGFEILERIRREPRTRGVPVVVLSASDHDRDIERAYRLGANSYVVKPIAFHVFFEVAGAIAGYWLVHNRTSRP